MECQEVQKLLFEFLEEELPVKNKEEIEAHLSVCESCQKERYLRSKSWRMLGSYEAPKPPDNFTSSLMHRIQSEKAQGDQKPKIKGPWQSFQLLISGMATGVGVGLVVLIVAYLLLKNLPESRESSILNLQTRQVTQQQPEQRTVYTAQQAITASRVNLPSPDQLAIPEKDRVVIQNLDILQNEDLLRHFNMVKDLDVMVNPNVGKM